MLLDIAFLPRAGTPSLGQLSTPSCDSSFCDSPKYLQTLGFGGYGGTACSGSCAWKWFLIILLRCSQSLLRSWIGRVPRQTIWELFRGLGLVHGAMSVQCPEAIACHARRMFLPDLQDSLGEACSSFPSVRIEFSRYSLVRSWPGTLQKKNRWQKGKKQNKTWVMKGPLWWVFCVPKNPMYLPQTSAKARAKWISSCVCSSPNRSFGALCFRWLMWQSALALDQNPFRYLVWDGPT